MGAHLEASWRLLQSAKPERAVGFVALLHLKKELPSILHPFNPNGILGKQKCTPICYQK